MNEVRLPLPAFLWLLLAGVSLSVLGGWFFYDVGIAVGEARMLVSYETSEMVRGQAMIEAADSAVVNALEAP